MVTANGQSVATIPPVFGFSLISSIKDMFDGVLGAKGLRVFAEEMRRMCGCLVSLDWNMVEQTCCANEDLNYLFLSFLVCGVDLIGSMFG